LNALRTGKNRIRPDLLATVSFNQMVAVKRPSRSLIQYANVKHFGMADTEAIPTQPEDLANFMDQIFTQMEQKFTDMAQQVLGRIDEMSTKINELEQSIDQLMSQADADAK
jgi:heat shock factor-binding protein 1